MDAQITSAGVLTAAQASAAITQTVKDHISEVGVITPTRTDTVLTPFVAQVVAAHITDAGSLTAAQVGQDIAREVDKAVSTAGVLTTSQISAAITPVVTPIAAARIAAVGPVTATRADEDVAQEVKDAIANAGALSSEEIPPLLSAAVAQAVAASVSTAGALTAAQVRAAITPVAATVVNGQIASAGALTASQAQEVVTAAVTQVVSEQIAVQGALAQLITNIVAPEKVAAIAFIRPLLRIAFDASSRAFPVGSRFSSFLGAGRSFLSFRQDSSYSNELRTTYITFDGLGEPYASRSTPWVDMLKTTYIQYVSNQQCYFWVPPVYVGDYLRSPCIFLPMAQTWGNVVEGYLDIDLEIVARPTSDVQVYLESFVGYQGFDGQGGVADVREPGTPAPEILPTGDQRRSITVFADASQGSAFHKFVAPIKYQRKAPFAQGAIDNQYFIMATVDKDDSNLKVNFYVKFFVQAAIPIKYISRWQTSRTTPNDRGLNDPRPIMRV